MANLDALAGKADVAVMSASHQALLALRLYPHRSSIEMVSSSSAAICPSSNNYIRNHAYNCDDMFRIKQEIRSRTVIVLNKVSVHRHKSIIISSREVASLFM